MEQAYVYLLASSFQKLYVGVTTKLQQRVSEHKESFDPNSFTSRYKIDKLVYYEICADIVTAIARERQIKGWLRKKKIALIVSTNPTWRDLSLDWNKPIEPFDESKLRPPITF